MSKPLTIGALALAIAFVSGSSVAPLAVGRVDSAAQGNVTGSPRDRAAIQQIVTTFDQTWGSDPVTYAAQYGSVIDWVGPTGTVLNDPAAITALYTFLFTGIFEGTTRISTIRNLTFLTGTIAVLDIETQVVGFARALEKNILIKRAGEWRIHMHQQTLITP
jgi:hypothetical protein